MNNNEMHDDYQPIKGNHPQEDKFYEAIKTKGIDFNDPLINSIIKKVSAPKGTIICHLHLERKALNWYCNQREFKRKNICTFRRIDAKSNDFFSQEMLIFKGVPLVCYAPNKQFKLTKGQSFTVHKIMKNNNTVKIIDADHNVLEVPLERISKNFYMEYAITALSAHKKTFEKGKEVTLVNLQHHQMSMDTTLYLYYVMVSRNRDLNDLRYLDDISKYVDMYRRQFPRDLSVLREQFGRDVDKFRDEDDKSIGLIPGDFNPRKFGFEWRNYGRDWTAELYRPIYEENKRRFSHVNASNQTR